MKKQNEEEKTKQKKGAFFVFESFLMSFEKSE
jgi:hypothetical protein